MEDWGPFGANVCECYGRANYFENSNKLPTKSDHKLRRTGLCQDNQEIRATMKAARSKIYDQGYAVTSEVVEKILKDESLVPAEVSSHFDICYSEVYIYID